MDKTERFWDGLAQKFDKRAERFEKTAAKTIERAKRYLRSGDFVLDYACATGTISCELASHVQEIYGIDISSNMVEAATRKAAGLGIANARFARKTIFDDELQRESYDVILALNILHLVPEDTRRVVERVGELLKPGGVMISATACLGERKGLLNLIMFLLLTLAYKAGAIPFLRFFAIAGLEESIRQGRFQVVETETLLNFPLNRFVVAKKI